MAMSPTQNDSIITTGLDVAEETEKAGGEIASALDKETAEMAGPEMEQSPPDQYQADLQEARELAQAAREHEAAERGQELEQAPELERDAMER